MSTACPLVLIEWEDSLQPTSHWQLISDLDESGTVKCASVGWLVRDGAGVKSLAPNLGHVNEDSVQASGVIQIPTRCIIKMTTLDEPIS